MVCSALHDGNPECELDGGVSEAISESFCSFALCTIVCAHIDVRAVCVCVCVCVRVCVHALTFHGQTVFIVKLEHELPARNEKHNHSTNAIHPTTRDHTAPSKQQLYFVHPTTHHAKLTT